MKHLIKDRGQKTKDKIRYPWLIILCVFFLASCGSVMPPRVTVQGIQLTHLSTGTTSPAAGTRQTSPQPTNSPYYTGTGGRGISLAIFNPTPINLTQEDAHFDALVQGELLQNFRNFSAMDIFERETQERAIAKLEIGPYRESEEFMRFGELVPADYYLLSSIRRTYAQEYLLGLRILNMRTGIVRATHQSTVNVASIRNLSAIRTASEALLGGMGVTLTPAGRQALHGVDQRTLDAQIALARGVTAQRQGFDVAAMVYSTRAAQLDPSLFEAVNRSSILSVNISSGHIGMDARNDINWRNEWVARLTETEQLFHTISRNERIPYTFSFTGDVRPGAINYRDNTMALSIETNLHPHGSWAVPLGSALQTVWDGLEATGRRTTWGLGGWPSQGETNLRAFERQSSNFSIVAELVNSRGQVIGRQTFQKSGHWGWNHHWNRSSSVSVSSNVSRTITFPAVRVADIDDVTTVRIASVNGIPAETAARDGLLQIVAMTRAMFDQNRQFHFAYGEVRGFAMRERSANLVIPGAIWSEPVNSIGSQAFQRAQLTSVTIPNSVTRIGNGAFANNQLTRVVIPNSVTYIGNNAFANNQLTNVTIPNTVTRIGNGAFENAFADGNRLTIPNGVFIIGERAFSNNGLTGVTIGNSVTRIEARAFENNQLTSVTIPNSVVYIGERAFYGNRWTTRASDGRTINHQLSNITIGSNVQLYGNSFPIHTWWVDGRQHSAPFLAAYNRENRRAGIYRLQGSRWNFFEDQETLARTDARFNTLTWVVGGLGLAALAGVVVWAAITYDGDD